MIEELKKELDAIKIIPVGSRATCDPAPENTDIDYLVLVKKRTCPVGWELDTGGVHYEPSEGEFNSWRKGNVNLIVTDSYFFYDKFVVATKLAKRFNLLDKRDRIALFQGVLYGREYEIYS